MVKYYLKYEKKVFKQKFLLKQNLFYKFKFKKT